MIQRVVEIHLKDEFSKPEKLELVAQHTREVLGSIDMVSDLIVAVPADARTRTEWDLLILLRLVDMKAVEAYRTETTHRAFVDVYLRPMMGVVARFNLELGGRLPAPRSRADGVGLRPSELGHPVEDVTPDHGRRGRWKTTRSVNAVKIEVRVPSLASAQTVLRRCPLADRFLAQPDRDVPTAPEATLVLAPVPHSILRLVLAVDSARLTSGHGYAPRSQGMIEIRADATAGAEAHAAPTPVDTVEDAGCLPGTVKLAGR